MFNVFGILLVVVVILLALDLGRAVGEWLDNNSKPVLAEQAVVIGKRDRLSGGGDRTVWTSYYATFELNSGGRKEFWVGDSDYGLLAEGDRGRLSFQGTRYLGFERSGG